MTVLKTESSNSKPNSKPIVKLQDIYIPSGDSLVIEFEIHTKTTGGIELPQQSFEKYNQEQSFAKKVIVVGSDSLFSL